MSTLFTEIIKGNIPCDKVYEDEKFFAFRDIAPQAPIHIIIVPKKPIKNLGDASHDDALWLGEMLLVAKKIATQEGILDNFRVVSNSGPSAGQSVFHIHFHLLGGRPLANLLG
jgi:histidine triad (HIT) family protein